MRTAGREELRRPLRHPQRRWGEEDLLTGVGQEYKSPENPEVAVDGALEVPILVDARRFFAYIRGVLASQFGSPC